MDVRTAIDKAQKALVAASAAVSDLERVALNLAIENDGLREEIREKDAQIESQR